MRIVLIALAALAAGMGAAAAQSRVDGARVSLGWDYTSPYAWPPAAQHLNAAKIDANGYQYFVCTSGCTGGVGGTGTIAQTNSAAPISAVALAAAGTAQQLASAATVTGVSLLNQSASDTLCIGTSSAVAYFATGPHCQNGWPLAPGASQGFAGSNANLYWFNGPTAGTSTGGDWLSIAVQ